MASWVIKTLFKVSKFDPSFNVHLNMLFYRCDVSLQITLKRIWNLSEWSRTMSWCWGAAMHPRGRLHTLYRSRTRLSRRGLMFLFVVSSCSQRRVWFTAYLGLTTQQCQVCQLAICVTWVNVLCSVHSCLLRSMAISRSTALWGSSGD